MQRFMTRLTHDCRGSNLIETSFSLLIALPIVLWLLEMTMCCYSSAVLQYAAREGVQYAVTHGTDSANCSGPGGNVNSTCSDATGANVKSLVKSLATSTGHNMASLSNTVTWSNNTNNPGDPITVRISYPYSPYVKLPWLPATIQGTATGKIVY